MAEFLTVAAKHCPQAEHSPQIAAGSFNLSLAGVTQPVKREETIVQQKGYNLIDP
jgi:hypothetical protein